MFLRLLPLSSAMMSSTFLEALQMGDWQGPQPRAAVAHAVALVVLKSFATVRIFSA